MLRLHTVGRRSGHSRVAIVGYFEDGPNLVTLAMNGWGKAEPAWWLNLQANPAATVDLADGSREVRARAASGAERERLWATFDDYPGWGSDLGALAAASARRDRGRRPRAEGRARTDERGDDNPGGRCRARRPPGGGAGEWPTPSAGDTCGSSQGSRSRSSRTSSGKTNGVGILLLIAFGIAPDLPRLLGLGPGAGRARFAAPGVQRPAPPGGAGRRRRITATGVVPVFWLVGALVWLGHVVIGWGLGDVRRHAAEHRSKG